MKKTISLFSTAMLFTMLSCNNEPAETKKEVIVVPETKKEKVIVVPETKKEEPKTAPVATPCL